MPGARDSWHIGVAELGGGARHGIHAVGVERLRGISGDLHDLDLQAALLAQFLGIGLDLGRHGVDDGVGGVAQVDGELDVARNHVAAVREHLHHAHRAAAMRLVAQRGGHHFLHQVCGYLQRILAQRHGRGAGVRLHTGHGAVEPADAQHALHHADGDVVVFEHRALFDVGFEIGTNRVVTRLLRADVADSLQLFLDRLARRILRGVGMLQCESLGEHA